MKTKTRQNAKSSDELQVVKNETERGNAGSKQARLVLVRCAELQTIDPKTKKVSPVSQLFHGPAPRSPLSTGSQSGSATKTFHVSLHRSQCHKNTCISLRDTALAGINYRQSGGGTRTWRAAGGYVRHIADTFKIYHVLYVICIIRLIPLPLRTQEVRCRSCVSRHTRASSTCTPSAGRHPPGARRPDRAAVHRWRCTGLPDHVRGLARRFV